MSQGLQIVLYNFTAFFTIKTLKKGKKFSLCKTRLVYLGELSRATVLRAMAASHPSFARDDQQQRIDLSVLTVA